ncbi:MAG: hypothetical protein IPN68_17240 [Bacteroidetes bacterium]|nr:hypothetical protein [Bacteroidota bacterium]
MARRIVSVLGIIIYATALLTINAQDQQKEGMAKYTPDFKFRDGVFLDFEMVKQNKPIPKAKLLASFDYNDREFFKKIFEMDKIYFYDDIGVRQEVDKNSVWGYARNGILYIQVQEGFNRITFVGNICHFVADITTEDSRYYNNPYSPYGYYDPYYSPYSYGSYYSPYSSYSPYYSPYGRSPSTRTELRQFIIDWETGKVMEFETDNTELLLMKDPALYEEYVQLSRSKKKDLMFVYIRKFNEKNPLYLPVE